MRQPIATVVKTAPGPRRAWTGGDGSGRRLRGLAVTLLAVWLAACVPALTSVEKAEVPPAATRQPQSMPTAAEQDAAATPPTPPQILAEGAEQSPSPVAATADWQDRSVFRAGLAPEAQAVLDEQDGAPFYRIDLAIGDDLVSVQGSQEVHFTNTEDVPLQEVVFRLFPNLMGGSSVVSNVTVNGQPVTPVLEQQDTVLRVPLAQPLAPGEAVVIGMDFDVAVPADGGSNYAVLAYLDGVLTLAHVYPMVAVYDEQGWNTEIAPPIGDVVYADSGYYLVRVTTPADLVIAPSGVILDEELQDGQRVSTIANGPARDFYLAASRRYDVVSQTFDGITFNSYSRPELAEGAAVVLESAVRAVERFEELIGPYPYTELDLVETGTAAAGVEYPGLMAIAGRLYQEDRASLLEPVTVHEAAHQWFYNVVGNDQVDEPWLDESLVQYVTMRYYSDVYGRQGYLGFRDSLLDRWDRVEREEIPVGLPVAAYDGTTYAAIVYGRGALFFEALQEAMGEEGFDEFLRDYYRTSQWGMATTESLKSLAEEHCQCDLSELFDAWIYAR